MEDIKIEFKGLIPPLRPEERQGLEASLLKEGCRDALVVWHGILLDGPPRGTRMLYHCRTKSMNDQ